MNPSLSRSLFPALLPLFLGGACRNLSEMPSPAGPDPTQKEVPLPANNGWRASLVIDNGRTGVWTVQSYPFFAQYGSKEIIGLDDLGRCLIMVGYSGKWTPMRILEEGRWLGGLAHGDVDPRIPGAELYTGGQKGNLYQVRPYPHGAVDCRLIAHFPGLEIHTLVLGDLDPRREGREVLVFTRPGALFRVSPTGRDGGFVTEELATLPGRVRDALVLPARPGEVPEIATVSRAGWLKLLRLTKEGPRWTTVLEGEMGMGRLALKDPRPGQPLVLYSTQDDGRILRHERGKGGAWRTETIYNGPQGPRGIVSGRFDQDPGVETVAVFGYSGKVELLTRTPKGWRVEMIFQDRDKGHWLGLTEVDGRNGTREILASGYGARIVLLYRPPGYGRRDAIQP